MKCSFLFTLNLIAFAVLFYLQIRHELRFAVIDQPGIPLPKPSAEWIAKPSAEWIAKQKRIEDIVKYLRKAEVLKDLDYGGDKHILILKGRTREDGTIDPEGSIDISAIPEDLKKACVNVEGIVCAVHKQGKGSNKGWKETWFFRINHVLENSDHVPPTTIRQYKGIWGSIILFKRSMCKLSDWDDGKHRCHFTSNNAAYTYEKFQEAIRCTENCRIERIEFSKLAIADFLCQIDDRFNRAWKNNGKNLVHMFVDSDIGQLLYLDNPCRHWQDIGCTKEIMLKEKLDCSFDLRVVNHIQTHTGVPSRMAAILANARNFVGNLNASLSEERPLCEEPELKRQTEIFLGNLYRRAQTLSGWFS